MYTGYDRSRQSLQRGVMYTGYDIVDRVYREVMYTGYDISRVYRGGLGSNLLSLLRNLNSLTN